MNCRRKRAGGAARAGSASVALPFFLALAVLFAMAYGGWKWYQVAKFESARSESSAHNVIGPPLTSFELTERSGETFRSKEMLGKVWVATFFFTTCPGECIRLNQNIKLLNDIPELEDVTWVSITCDPDTDTVEALREYADRWEADPDRWLFVREDLEYIQRVALGMKVPLFRKGHRDDAIVIDKWGQVRGYFDATSKSECIQLQKKLVECLAEENPPEDEAAKASPVGAAEDSAAAG